MSASSKDNSIAGRPNAVMQAIEDFSTSKFIMTFKKAKIQEIRSLLEALPRPPKVVIELGGYIGNSAIAWGDILRSLHEPTASDLKVFSVEPIDEFVEIARYFVELAGLSDIVEVINGHSAGFLKSLKSQHGIDHVDVLFMDHWEDDYLKDLRLVEDLGLLNVGSVIVADNTDVPGAPDYLDYVRSESKTTSGFQYATTTVQTEGRAGDPVSCLIINQIHY